MGGNDFAVMASAEFNPCYAWRAFSSTQTYQNFWMSTTVPCYYTFYSPIALKCTNIKIYNVSSGMSDTVQPIKTGTVQASNDNFTWIQVGTFTNSNSEWDGSFNITLNTTDFYNYYRININSVFSQYAVIAFIELTAYYTTSVTNSITLPYAHNNTNYAFSLGNIGSYNTSYVNTKTTTSMYLTNPEASSGTMNFMTIGY